MKSYIIKFYKDLFGPSEHEDFNIDETRREDIPQISAEGNEKLVAQFTEEEVKDVNFQMKHLDQMDFLQNFIRFFGKPSSRI